MRMTALNRLTNLVHRGVSNELLAAYSYELAPDGQRTNVIELLRGTTPGALSTNLIGYTYDNLNRLIREEALAGDGSGGYTADYSYDVLGSRLERTVTTGGQILRTQYAYNANDQLVSESNSVTVVALPVRYDERYAQVVYRPLPSPWSRTMYGFMALPLLVLLAFFVPMLFSRSSENRPGYLPSSILGFSGCAVWRPFGRS